MSIIKLASAVTALGLLLAAGPAFAQTVCPEASEGTPCDGGFCVPATCNFATGDGGTTESACGLCIPSEPVSAWHRFRPWRVPAARPAS